MSDPQRILVKVGGAILDDAGTRARFAASGESGGVPGTASSSSSDSLLLPGGRVAAAPGSAERGTPKRWLG